MDGSTSSKVIAAEVRGLREGCGLVERSWVECLELRGADRQRFLNAYVTCDVKGLKAGEGVYGFLTNPQGRVLADLEVLAAADWLWAVLPAGQVQAVNEHLRRYVIADRVEFVRRDPAAAAADAAAPLVALTLAGPRADAAMAELAPGVALPVAVWHHVGATVADVQVVVERTGRLGVPAVTLWTPGPEAARLRDALLACQGVSPVSREACEVVRVEAGIARFGQDFGPQNFPQETGAADAVSYTKGCYLGQEVVARIHYRGGVQKMLCGLLFDETPRGGDASGAPASPSANLEGGTPEHGTPLLYEGREAGRVGTAVRSPASGRSIGLAILHRRAAEPGTRLDVAVAVPAGGGEVAAAAAVTGEGAAPAAAGGQTAPGGEPPAGHGWRGSAQVCALPFGPA